MECYVDSVDYMMLIINKMITTHIILGQGQRKAMMDKSYMVRLQKKSRVQEGGQAKIVSQMSFPQFHSVSFNKEACLLGDR